MQLLKENEKLRYQIKDLSRAVLELQPDRPVAPVL